MAKKKKEEVPLAQMKKPPFKIGEHVIVTFLGSDRKCELIALRKHQERWIYSAKDLRDGFKYVCIGINGSEKFANIWTIPKETPDDELDEVTE